MCEILNKPFFKNIIDFTVNFFNEKRPRARFTWYINEAQMHNRLKYIWNMEEFREEKEELMAKYTTLRLESRFYNGSLFSGKYNDGLLPGYSHDSSWEFLNPFSEEFRGIYELYGLVMYKLILIFTLLLLVVGYTLYKDFIIFYENRDEVLNVIKENGINLVDTYWDLTYLYYLAIEAKEAEEDPTFIKTEAWIKANQIFNKSKIKADSLLGKIERFLTKLHVLSLKSNLLSFCASLEFFWTAIPCIILVFISIPSFTLALALDETHKPESWIKIVGNQWFWTYEYSSYKENLAVSANVSYGVDINNNSLRLLQPDIFVTLPCNKVSRILVTSVDVIHCWAVPSLGIKIDAVPGRVNSLSILPTKAGFYYGQCSEICGVNHGFMPICVEVI